jgi:hypothetical protein
LRGRGSPGNSDSRVSGSLATPPLLSGGKPEEGGDEANETVSQSYSYGAGGLGRGQRQPDAPQTWLA